MRNVRYILTLAALLLGFGLATSGQAQSKFAPDTTALNELYENIEPAELIAPGLLGVGSKSVSRPSGIQDVSLSLIRSFANLPNSGEGIGIEFSPVQLLEKTKFDSIKPKALASRITTISQKIIPQYKALEDYRKSYGWRPFVISGAAVTDSVASRLAIGFSYTFGAGQLDPYKAKGFMEDLTADITKQLLGPGTTVAQLETDYNNLLVVEIERSIQKAGIVPPRSGDIKIFLFNCPIAKLPNPTATSSSKIPDGDSIKQVVTTYLNTNATLTSTEKSTIAQVLAEKAIPAYQALYPATLSSLKPLFTATKNLVSEATEAFEKRNWNVPLLQVGAGQAWRSADKSWDGLTRQSIHGFVYGSIRPPESWEKLSQHTQLIGNLQYVYQDSDTLKQQLGYGLRLLAGNERLRFSAEGSWKHQRYRAVEGKTQDPNIIRRYTVGLEVRVADNLWLEMAVGRTNAAATPGQVTDKSSILTLADLKYGFRNRRRFAVQ